MNINDPASFNHQIAFVNGINIHYVDQNPSSPDVILCVHGWPDLWYGWRNQIVHLANKGYRVIAVDLRGFGESDAPADPAAYGYGTVSADLVALLDHLEIPKIIILGHDWGGFVVWRFAAFYPDRVRAIASFCTPFTPPSDKYLSLQDTIKIIPSFVYMEFLASPESEVEFEGNIPLFFRIMFRPASDQSQSFYDRERRTVLKGREDVPKSDRVPQEVLDYYVKQYSVRGFRGPQNWYRQTENNFEQSKGLPKTIEHRALMVTAGKDKALPPSMAKDMHKFVADLTLKNVEDAGHWILWDKPEEVNAYLDEWLPGVQA